MPTGCHDEGIADGLFFRFWGDLMLRASKPVDVIDLGRGGKFSEIVRREGLAEDAIGADPAGELEPPPAVAGSGRNAATES